MNLSATTLATPDSLSTRASTTSVGSARRSLSILEESSLPLGLAVTCSSHAASVERARPPSLSARLASCAGGILATALWQNAPRPEAVSSVGIISSMPSKVTVSTATPSGDEATCRSTRLTSSFPSVISFCSRSSCSMRSAFSFSRRLRMRSRAFSSSSGPSSPSTYFFLRFFLPFFLAPPTSSSSSESDASASESSESSSPTMSSNDTSLNTSSNGSPASPFMT